MTTLNYNRKYWDDRDCAVFFRTREKYGELSNMCSGFPITYNNLKYPTSEHLYQAMKYDDEKIKLKIIAEKSPISAKMVSRSHSQFEDPNWISGSIFYID